MRSRILFALLLLGLLAVLGACDTPPGGGVKTLGPGKHTVTSGMYGLWEVEPVAKSCHWTVGKDSFEGSGTDIQTVQLGTAQKGLVFWSNDGCGTWRKK